MKFALYDFFKEGTIEIGLTDFIDVSMVSKHGDKFTTSQFNNEDWDAHREVIVNWPSKVKGSKTSSEYVACVVYFSDDRRDQEMLRLRDGFINDDDKASTTTTSTKRSQKRPIRFQNNNLDSDEDDASSAGTTRVKKTKKGNQSKDGLVEKLIHRKEATKKQASELSAYSEIDDLRVENRRLVDELHKVKMEKKAALAAVALAKELPELLNQVKSLTKTHKPKPIVPRSNVAEDKIASPSPSPSPSPKFVGDACKSSMNKNAPKMVQDLMSAQFTRQEMASHSLTGAKSNANNGVEAKPQLDKETMDIIFVKVQAAYPDTDMKYIRGGTQQAFK